MIVDATGYSSSCGVALFSASAWWVVEQHAEENCIVSLLSIIPRHTSGPEWGTSSRQVWKCQSLHDQSIIKKVTDTITPLSGSLHFHTNYELSSMTISVEVFILVLWTLVNRLWVWMLCAGLVRQLHIQGSRESIIWVPLMKRVETTMRFLAWWTFNHLLNWTISTWDGMLHAPLIFRFILQGNLNRGVHSFAFLTTSYKQPHVTCLSKQCLSTAEIQLKMIMSND